MLLPGIKPCFLGFPAYSLVTMLTELLHLLIDHPSIFHTTPDIYKQLVPFCLITGAGYVFMRHIWRIMKAWCLLLARSRLNTVWWVMFCCWGSWTKAHGSPVKWSECSEVISHVWTDSCRCLRLTAAEGPFVVACQRWIGTIGGMILVGRVNQSA
jgi:hypothetical protein